MARTDDRPGSTAVRLPRAERRAQLVAAAGAAFLRKGFDATAMEEVADEAGVTRLIVYRHFESKEALYRAVLTSVTGELRARFEGIAPPAVVATLVDVARAHPDAFRLLWRHARHEPLFAAEAELFRVGATAYADVIVGHRVDPAYRQWVVATVVEHLHEGICIWLDAGDPARDAQFTHRLRAGARALVAAWSR